MSKLLLGVNPILLKEELARRQGLTGLNINIFGYDFSKDKTHHWERVERPERVGCWTDPWALQCSTCGEVKGAGAQPVQFICTNSGNHNPLVSWRGFP